MTPSLDSLLLTEQATIRDALVSLDAHGLGLCFVVSANRRLVGVASDGDLRRALLGGGTLDSTVSGVIQRECVALQVSAPALTVLKTLSTRIRVIPLLDETGVVVDYAAAGRLHQIPVMEPHLCGNEVEYVTECLRTNWISSQGRFVREFEKQFTDYLERPAIAVSNGTVALHLSLVALGIGPGDEVIVPNLTFAATINAVLHTGARPVLVDIEPTTWGIDPALMEAAVSPRTRAVVPVHLYGSPANMEDICEVAQRHNLLVIEDCAESLGSRFEGALTGTFGDAATFSFFGNKTITTGEGGMVAFRSEVALDRASALRDHGMSRTRRYWHDFVGFNYRMTNLQAAIGVAQMEQLSSILQKKSDIASAYDHHLSQDARLRLPPRIVGSTNTNWLYTVAVSDGVDRDGLIVDLLSKGIETRPVFYPLHGMPVYSEYGNAGDFPVSSVLSRTGLSLPSASTLTHDTVEFVCDQLRATLDGAPFLAGTLSNGRR